MTSVRRRKKATYKNKDTTKDLRKKAKRRRKGLSKAYYNKEGKVYGPGAFPGDYSQVPVVLVVGRRSLEVGGRSVPLQFN